MTRGAGLQKFAFLVLGIALGAVLMFFWRGHGLPGGMWPASAKASDADLQAMQNDIAHLKDVVPSQSHAMADVSFQFSNLWFAGEGKNWPLATFYLNEARQHIRWTIRIRPIRKSPAGDPVDLQGIYDAIDGGTMLKLQKAIDDKDSPRFEAQYKETLAECYSCHKASGKPYLRPMVPTAPPQTIINFDPNATWPQ